MNATTVYACENPEIFYCHEDSSHFMLFLDSTARKVIQTIYSRGHLWTLFVFMSLGFGVIWEG